MACFELTDEMVGILKHATAYPQHTRNHFVTGPGSTDYDACEQLIKAGLMRRREGSALTGGDYLYTVTSDGMSYLADLKTLHELGTELEPDYEATH